MNNEPVAWIDRRTNKCVVFINTPPSNDWIPLYTHPVKEQELLDEIRNLNIENADLKAKLELLKAVWL